MRNKNTFYGSAWDEDIETGISVHVRVEIVTPTEYNIDSGTLDEIAYDAVESVFVTAVPDLLTGD